MTAVEEPLAAPVQAAEPATHTVALQQGHIYSRKAAYSVCVISAAFVIVLFIYLFYISSLVLASSGKKLVPSHVKECEGNETCLVYWLEGLTQAGIAERVGFALNYRFTTSIAAIIVSLVMIILGSVLIFDRVITSISDSLRINAPQKGEVSLTSSYPGLILAFLGAGSLCLTAAMAGPWAKPITVTDVPLYIRGNNGAVYPRITIGGAHDPTKRSLTEAQSDAVSKLLALPRQGE